MSSALPAGGALRDPKALFSLLCPNGLLAEAASDRCMGNSEASVCAAFSQWPVILQANISRLAAFELLALLQDFESTQLAGVGLAGASLVSACILAAGGGYTGLMVRPERKSYGARRKIEGLPDPAAKVAVVVDALGTGRLLLDAIRSLEDGGMTVEGVVGLIELPYRGGAEELRSLGYRVATVFNSHSDYESPAKTETTSTMRMPAHLRPRQPQWSISKVPDGLHPAHAARVVAEHLVSTGEVLTPPRYFEQDENGSGGVWVSLRRRSDDHRVARNGFWHFDALESDVPIDVVLATAMTVQSCRPALTGEKLAELKIAVTFFSALEAVAPTALDFSRYGIVVRSRPFPSKMGGALPDTQYFTSTFEQYRHARETNAGIGAFEPHDVFRHPVTKRIEP
ncbi:MAG TPA: hypothetical protein VHT28_18285, partial [Silvibacterium sp.]|nr:hypothetical protein [Silvibacterium sp.]